MKELILSILKSNADISTQEMAKQMNVSYGSMRHHLEKLKNKGIIRREGADKGGRWIIINQKNN